MAASTDPIAILKSRLARGEISVEEYRTLHAEIAGPTAERIPETAETAPSTNAPTFGGEHTPKPDASFDDALLTEVAGKLPKYRSGHIRKELQQQGWSASEARQIIEEARQRPAGRRALRSAYGRLLWQSALMFVVGLLILLTPLSGDLTGPLRAIPPALAMAGPLFFVYAFIGWVRYRT